MKDRYERTVDYMRISITDRCNLRCEYCMPRQADWTPLGELLSLDEIKRICQAAAKTGISKIKITGGEPLVRKDCLPLIGTIKAIPGIQQVTITTNGVYLSKYAKELVEQGIDGVNVSLDTLNAKRYEQLTGYDALADVMNGIVEMEQYPIPLKLNVVLQKGKNEDEWQKLVELARNYPLDVRFIEMMPIGCGKGFDRVSNYDIQQRLKEMYDVLLPEAVAHGNGPAVYYKIPEFRGSIGFISAVNAKFCHQCNRIRLTAYGKLKPCLCFGEEIDLKHALLHGQEDEIKACIEKAILAKPKEHVFENLQSITEVREMVQIGG